jgi:tRNA pseudouridine55 synthase
MHNNEEPYKNLLENTTGSIAEEQNPLSGGLVAVYKPPGLASFAVVKRIRRAVGIDKVGHAGTLDRFAEGILVIGIGRAATRRLGELLNGDKEYLAEVRLGIVTDTYDPTGRIIETNSFIMPEKEAIEAVLRRFAGDIMQLPPPFSALKVDGVRMHKLARKGIEPQRKPRPVNIREIELIKIVKDGFEMRVVCSHGTYIRSLAYDIGRELGCGACLNRLVRTRVGSYTLAQAIDPEELVNLLRNSGEDA